MGVGGGGACCEGVFVDGWWVVSCWVGWLGVCRGIAWAWRWLVEF